MGFFDALGWMHRTKQDIVSYVQSCSIESARTLKCTLLFLITLQGLSFSKFGYIWVYYCSLI